MYGEHSHTYSARPRYTRTKSIPSLRRPLEGFLLLSTRAPPRSTTPRDRDRREECEQQHEHRKCLHTPRDHRHDSRFRSR